MSKKLKTWNVYGVVTGSKYLGEYQAETKEEAEDMALRDNGGGVSLCHRCSTHIDDPAVESAEAEEVGP